MSTRYYKGVRPCEIEFRPIKHNKCIIRFLDDNSKVITLIRLVWRNTKESNNKTIMECFK